MTRYIFVRNAWGDGMKAETSFVPELLAPWEKLKTRCRENGIELIESVDDPGLIEAVVFIDCPPTGPVFTHCFDNKVPYLLVISENLHLQPNQTYGEVGGHAARILSYEANPLFPEKTTRLRYPVDLQECLKLRLECPQTSREFLIGMINGCKASNMPGDLYRKRLQYAYALAPALGGQFALWGHGWPNMPNLYSLPPGPGSKHSAYRRCEFAIVLENCNSISGYVTEKLFNALAAGCLPIYEYCDDGEIPENCYVNAARFDHPYELMDYCNEMTAQEKAAMYEAGTKFLSGVWDGAIFFSDLQYVDTIYKAIRAIL